MTREPIKVSEDASGLFFESPFGHAVFFKKNVSYEKIRDAFPHGEFHRLKQTHSDVSAIAASTTKVSDPTAGFSNVEGDALVTRDFAPLTIGVSTADCLPVLIIGEEQCAAIHAGWKGVANEIILKTLRDHFSQSQNLVALIGPHIQWNSFEVDRALGEKFLEQYQKLARVLKQSSNVGAVLKESPTDIGKSFICLSLIASLQLELGGIAKENIWISTIDTKPDLSWASYRREGKNMGKNLSFVARRSR